MAFIDLGISGLQPFAYETLTAGTGVGQLTEATFRPANAAPARAALIFYETQPVRVRMDGGGNPVATGAGHQFNDKDQQVLRQLTEMRNFRFTRDAGADGTLRVTYYR
jgi:hypothetical protein